MLAGAAPDDYQITKPMLASRKLDGIRCVVEDGVALSRSLKPIRNEVIQNALSDALSNHFDGELIVGAANAPNVMQVTTSGVMSASGIPDFTFYVFDYRHPTLYTEPFSDRYEVLKELVDRHPSSSIQVLEHVMIESTEQLKSFEEQALSEGYEGVILRDPDGHYKFGRNSSRESLMLKVKRFTHSEAIILDSIEQLHNNNKATTNALGLTERSTHKDNKIPAGVLGAWLVRDCETGLQFTIGGGFTAHQRKEFWENRDRYHGKMIRYKSFPVGVKELPRFPVFDSFRDPDDMS
jgi:DNA ligase-1